MAMRTPLRRVRGLGSAHEGTDHFWMQRLTSVAAVPLTIVVVGVVLAAAGADFAAARALIGSPVVAIVLLLTVAVYVLHMHIGMQEIIIDYVHAPAAKIASLMLNTAFAAVVGLACVFAILKLAFGS